MIEYPFKGQVYRIPDGLSPFQLKMYLHLIDWKWANITREAGHHIHKEEPIPYDAILPDDCASQEKMPHIHKTAQVHLAAHRQQNRFRIHPHFYHMASSQAANINLFLPVLHHPQANSILGSMKADFKSLATDQLDHGYCLEYWGGNYDPEKAGKGPLGDKSARAGTDSDIAIAYRNHGGELCLWLIEHKLVEAEFTTCGGFKSKGRKDKIRHDCTRSFSDILSNKNTCYYHDVCGYRYWDITAANPGFFVNHADHAGCPFQGGMNQLWRNQLLALAIQREGQPFKHVQFSVVHHPDNKALNPSLTAYKALIADNPQFSAFTSSAVLEAAKRHADAGLREWIAWYRSLYFYDQPGTR